MPEIQAKLPDGTILSFPDGTPDAVVDRAVQEHMASPDYNVQSGGSFKQHGQDTGIVAGAQRALTGLKPSNIAASVKADSPFLSGPITMENADERVAQYEAAMKDAADHPIASALNMVPLIGPTLANWARRAPTDLLGATSEAVVGVGVPTAIGLGITKGAPPAVRAITERLPTTPAKSIELAQRANQYVKANPISKGIEDVNIYKPGTIVRGAARVITNPIARGVAKGADMLAERQLAQNAEATLAEQAKAYTQPIPNAPNTVRTPRVVPEEPYMGNALEQPVSPPEPPAYTQPIPNAPNTVRPLRSPQAEVHNPAMFQEQAPLQDLGPALPEATPVRSSVDILRETVRPTGKSQTWLTGKDFKTGKLNADLVFEFAPELKGLHYGSQEYLTKSYNAFKSAESIMDRAHESVPLDRMVPKEGLVDGLLAVRAEAAAANQMPATLTRLADQLDNLPPNMKWSDFLNLKQKFRSSPGFANNEFVQKMYRVMMDEAAKVSPGVQAANKDFSTMMRLMEASKINPQTGFFKNAEATR